MYKRVWGQQDGPRARRSGKIRTHDIFKTSNTWLAEVNIKMLWSCSMCMRNTRQTHRGVDIHYIAPRGYLIVRAWQSRTRKRDARTHTRQPCNFLQ